VEDRLRYLVKFITAPKPPALPEIKPEPVNEEVIKEPPTEKVFDIFKKRKPASSPCKASQLSPTKSTQLPLSPTKLPMSPTKPAPSPVKATKPIKTEKPKKREKKEKKADTQPKKESEETKEKKADTSIKKESEEKTKKKSAQLVLSFPVGTVPSVPFGPTKGVTVLSWGTVTQITFCMRFLLFFLKMFILQSCYLRDHLYQTWLPYS